MEPNQPYHRNNSVIDDDDDSVGEDGDMDFTKKKKEYIQEEKITKGTAGELSHALPSEEAVGCCGKILGTLRKLWATSMTEDIDDRDTKKRYRITLRQFIIYLGFLAILCAVAFGMMSPKMYYYTKVMSNLFIDTEINRTRHNFRNLATKQDLWQFLEVTLLDGLYWEKANSNPNVTEDETYIYNENKLLGVPRLRQLKVRKDSCSVHEDFKSEISECYDVYSEKEEQQDQFGLENGTAWIYQSSKELSGSTHWGLIATYGGGGYVQNLAKNKAKTARIINELRVNRWIDRGTRVVFIDFTVYNANVNLFCVIRMVAEFPATGGVIPSWKFHTVKLIRYTNVSDYVVFACEVIFILYLLYYTIEECIEINKHQFSYFKHFWSILDFVMIMFGYGCVIFNVYRYIRANSKMETLLEDPYAYPDFEFLAYWQVVFNNACAILVFLAWLKMFKVINFNRTMTQLSTTVARCAKDLVGFAIMFIIIFLAFAQLGYLIFGTQVEDFKTFSATMFTLFRILLGDFDFHSLETSNRILGPAYFVLYVFFIFFVLLNMFLAIINDSYSEAKDLIPDTKITFGMGDYIKMGYKAILTKLKFKRDKLGDMKMALEAAHVRHDRVLTLGDWKQDLISRGYKTEEITAVFEKYDTDHDGKLNELEQKQLEIDLQKQEETLASEFRDLDAMEAEDDDIDMSIHGTDLAGVSSQEFLVLSNEVETISNRMEVLEVEVTKVRNSIKKILKHLGREEIWA